MLSYVNSFSYSSTGKPAEQMEEGRKGGINKKMAAQEAMHTDVRNCRTETIPHVEKKSLLGHRLPR
jgi:hypothetical protein